MKFYIRNNETNMLLWKIKASPNGDSNFMGQTNSLQEQKLSTQIYKGGFS